MLVNKISKPESNRVRPLGVRLLIVTPVHIFLGYTCILLYGFIILQISFCHRGLCMSRPTYRIEEKRSALNKHSPSANQVR